MEWIALIVGASAAGMLLFSAAAKFSSLSSFSTTIEQFGFRGTLKNLVTLGVPAAEVVVAGVTVFVGGLVAATLIVALGVVFAGAGIRGLLASQPIPCHCFGSSSRFPLGWSQILLLPVWIVSGAVIAAWWRIDLGLEARFALFASAGMAAWSVAARQLLPQFFGLRSFRKATGI